MKKLFLLSILPMLCFTNLSSQVTIIPPYQYTQGLQIASTTNYKLGSSVKDSTLDKDHGAVEFHFSSHTTFLDSIPCNSKVLFTVDGILDTADFISKTRPTRILTPGKHVFVFYVKDDYLEVMTDSIDIVAGERQTLLINFEGVQYEPYWQFNGIQEDKPVIYVYSDQPQPVSLQLLLNGKMGFTYPAYNGGWNFIADKNGNLFMNGKTYPYLFWEGETQLDYSSIDWENGSVVGRDSLVPFFEKNLAAMGLNEKEITDYITYWVPRMSKDSSCYIHFMLNEDYDDYAAMNITPAPDSKFQVFMIWTSSEGLQGSTVTPQDLHPFSRKGLTVVEWGGTELPAVPVIFESFDN